MSARYGILEFPTRLHAQWAALFDLAGWTWRTNVASIDDWQPDFWVSFPCGHSECGATHEILVSVLPVRTLDGVRSHPALSHSYDVKDKRGKRVADAGAVFGVNPSITAFEISHGAGGGTFTVDFWLEGRANALWDQAASKISV